MKTVKEKLELELELSGLFTAVAGEMAPLSSCQSSGALPWSWPLFRAGPAGDLNRRRGGEASRSRIQEPRPSVLLHGVFKKTFELSNSAEEVTG